jgi:hypothetical protein
MANTIPVVVKGEIKNDKLAIQICRTVALPGDRDLRNVKLMNIPSSAIQICANADEANLFVYDYGGGQRRLLRGAQLAIATDEYLFCASKYPGLYEPLPDGVRTVDDAALALVEQVRRAERHAEVKTAEANAAQAKLDDALAERARLAGRADTLAQENVKLQAEVKSLGEQLEAANKTLGDANTAFAKERAALEEKLAAAEKAAKKSSSKPSTEDAPKG